MRNFSAWTAPARFASVYGPVRAGTCDQTTKTCRHFLWNERTLKMSFDPRKKIFLKYFLRQKWQQWESFDFIESSVTWGKKSTFKVWSVELVLFMMHTFDCRFDNTDYCWLNPLTGEMLISFILHFGTMFIVVARKSQVKLEATNMWL